MTDRPFYGAECPSYPDCEGGCGLGCTKKIENARAAMLQPASVGHDTWVKILADNWRGRNGNSTTGDSVRNSCADELEKVAARNGFGAVAQGSLGCGDTMKFFSQNVDAWGALEWFDRLAKAIRQQDAAVVAGNMLNMETCRNVAASSAMRLVRDYEQQVRVALAISSTEGK